MLNNSEQKKSSLKIRTRKSRLRRREKSEAWFSGVSHKIIHSFLQAFPTPHDCIVQGNMDHNIYREPEVLAQFFIMTLVGGKLSLLLIYSS